MAQSIKKRRAWVKNEPSGHVKVSQSYDSILDGCLKIGGYCGLAGKP